MTVDTGTKLGDRYVLDERIATGGMGEVWRARDDLLDRIVAVKLLKREFAGDPGFVERFRAEARHAAGLGHPAIAGVYDYGEADGMAYLVMELVSGEPLSALLAGEGRLSTERALDIVAQAARALAKAHDNGVVHRDVKPGNILVCPDGTVKLTDFGIARAIGAVPVTRTGIVLGTAQYLSPEQANGGAVTPASDIYSLGVVAYECLAGQRPFDGDTPVSVALAHVNQPPPPLPSDVPAPVRELVARTLAKDPADRFASAAELATNAERVRARLDSAPTAPATAVLPVVAPPRRVPRRVVIAALVAIAALFLTVVAWSATRPAPKRPVPALVGKTKQVALAALDGRGLDAVEKAAYSTRYPAGAVMAQDPAAGTLLREGGDVSVTISRGPKPVRLPSGLSGQPLASVIATLERLGLRTTATGRESESEFGTVIAVTPATGLHEGDRVTVTYSLGVPRRGDDGKKHGKGEGDGD